MEEKIQTKEILSETQQHPILHHRHEWIRQENYLACSICNKKKIFLEKTLNKNIYKGKKKNGVEYSVRSDRRRYFFPDEWEKFLNTVANKEHRLFFLTCLHTGGRIMEVLNLKYSNIDIERGTVTFEIIKQRKAKKNFFASGNSRGFFLASNFIKEFKSYIRGKNINPNNYIFLDNNKLPPNYEDLDNQEKRKYFAGKIVSYSNLLKRKLKKAGVEDFYNFSPHNIRKTYGMWMRTFDKEMSELCYRMGHDLDTYIAHYGSSLVFTDLERRKIQKILGEVK